jgi:Protein of unknown function (DUF3551)
MDICPAANRSPWRLAVKTMRAAAILLALCPLTAIDARPSGAETYRPWCVVYSGRDGAYTCIFASFEQCMMTATPGTGGSCVQNPWYLRYGPSGPGTTGQGGRARR